MKGEISTIYLIDCDNIEFLKGDDNRYHYFYKIVNNINDNYYYGIHTTDNLDDNYRGSGHRLNNAYKVYGVNNFTKYVLRFFSSRKELLKYEKQIVTQELCNESKCYNIVPGGNGWDALLITVRDKNDNLIQINRCEFINNPNKYFHHSKGRIVLNNGIIHKYILPSELDKYLSEGWVKGEIEHITTNRINIKKNNKQKFVIKSELDKYLSEGWVKGVCQKTTLGYIKLTNGIENVSIDPNNTEQIEHYIDNGWVKGISRNVKKHIWVNNTNTSKMILLSELDKYLSEGWAKGRLKNDMPKRKIGVVVVSKDGIAKQIHNSQLSEYISNGWKRGNCNINPITNNGKLVVNKNGNNKFIKPEELDKYLSEGWAKGRVKKTPKY